MPTTPQPTSAIPTGIADSGVAPSAMSYPSPVYMQGGVTQQSAPPSSRRGMTFFDGITLLDIGMIALSALAIFMNIYYTRKQIFFLKANKSQIRNDIDELKLNVKNLMGDDYKPL